MAVAKFAYYSAAPGARLTGHPCYVAAVILVEEFERGAFWG